MKNSPKISIIIPTYNRAKIIGRTLDCIVAQIFTDWECFVVDDFSTDNTRELIDRYVQNDGRFHYMLNERKKGAQGARNTGLYHSTADWVWFMDSDDIVHDDFLEKMCGAIHEGVDVVTCYANIRDIKSQNVKCTYKWNCVGNIHEKLLSGECYVYSNNCIIRKSKLQSIGGMDENCPSHQEYDTHIRLSENACYTTIPETLIDYFVGGKDTISIDSERCVEGRIFLLMKYKEDWLRYKKWGIRFYNIIWNSITWSYTSRWKKLWAYMRLFMIAPNLYFIKNK